MLKLWDTALSIRPLKPLVTKREELKPQKTKKTHIPHDCKHKVKHISVIQSQLNIKRNVGYFSILLVLHLSKVNMPKITYQCCLHIGNKRQSMHIIMLSFSFYTSSCCLHIINKNDFIKIKKIKKKKNKQTNLL